ncbi:MAG: glycosyltransferase family 2 protein [Deltaproteobacteria bacterium]|nr:glycosyltransferase family 2 protein [Deltaproteobacteria bacterium]
MESVSIVVPIFNEEENIVLLHQDIKAVCEKNNYDYEIIFVDDGSTDKSAFVAKQLAPLRYVRLRRNFGQTAAMDSGIKAATKEYIITMDGDRQNDPSDIPNLISYLKLHDLDVVSGWRLKRQDSFSKKFFSRGAWLLRRLIVGDDIHDSGCSLKIYKRECFSNLTLYGEMHRFIPAVLKIQGFKIGEITVNHRPRTAGVTKYNWRRAFKGFVDMVAVWFWNRYSVRPLHLLGTLGIFLLLFGFGFSVWTIIEFFEGQSLSDTVLPLLSAVFLLSGVQIFLFGILGDMMSKTYFETGQGNSYSIKEIFENTADDIMESAKTMVSRASTGPNATVASEEISSYSPGGTPAMGTPGGTPATGSRPPLPRPSGLPRPPGAK